MFRATKRVSVNEFLEFLSSATHAKSTMGAQLENIKSRQMPEHTRKVSWEDEQGMMHISGQPIVACELNEQGIINDANLARCVETLTRQGSVKFAATDTLPQYARKLRVRPGMLAVCVARAYQPWALDVDAKRPAGEEGIGAWRGPERGLYEVYGWLRSQDRSLPPYEENTKKARETAARLLADADIVVIAWVELWNRDAGFATWMSVPEFALKYGHEQRTVRRWCEAGKLPAVLVKERYRINVSELDE